MVVAAAAAGAEKNTKIRTAPSVGRELVNTFNNLITMIHLNQPRCSFLCSSFALKLFCVMPKLLPSWLSTTIVRPDQD